MSDVRVNLGCGEFSPASWVNVDMVVNEHVHPTIIADVSKPLPFRRFSLTHMYAGHVLEHLTREDAYLALLDWRRYLTTDGVLLVVGPDVHRAYEMLHRGEITPQEFTDIRHGAKRWPGDAHLWKSTEHDTMTLMQLAGWTVTRADVWQIWTETDWPLASGTGWQFAAYGQAYRGKRWRQDAVG